MSDGIVTSIEGVNDALNEASYQMNRIMFSSGANPWLLAEFHDIMDFEEFTEVTIKLSEWSQEFNRRLTMEDK